MSKTRILWHSNAPHAPTGYGQQSALFVPELNKHYDVTVSSFYGLEGAPIKWEGVPILPPAVSGQFNDNWLVKHAERVFDGDLRGGLVMTLMDVWVLDPKWLRKMNVASWTPVDHEPAPPKVVDYFVQTNAIPIAMSRFGERMLGRLDPLYVPHAVDCEAYQPRGRERTRKLTGLPEDAFIVGMVAANKGRPSRKGFSQAFQAFAKFLEKHENAILYLHTMMDPALGGGEDLAGLLEALGIPEDNVRIADQYRMVCDPYSHASMALIYSALDVLLNPAMGEGFGITPLEAQACGVPVIVTDFSAMPEVAGAGWHTKPAQRYWTGLNAWQAIPDPDDILAALEECYGLSEVERDRLSRQARQHALKYNLPLVLKEHMLPALRRIEQRFASQRPVTIAPRKAVAA